MSSCTQICNLYNIFYFSATITCISNYTNTTDAMADNGDNGSESDTSEHINCGWFERAHDALESAQIVLIGLEIGARSSIQKYEIIQLQISFMETLMKKKFTNGSQNQILLLQSDARRPRHLTLCCFSFLFFFLSISIYGFFYTY